MKTAYEYDPSGVISYSYTSSGTSLGTTIRRNVDISNNLTYIGPLPINIARPMEASTTIAVMMPSVVTYSSGIDWVFFADNAAAAATRRVVLYEFNKNTAAYTWKGFVTLNFPGTVGNHTIRGFGALRYTDNTGICSANGTGVLGFGTQFLSNRHAVGARIGFGSNDPTQISTWYTISGILNDTTMEITPSAGSVASGNYVIDELRLLVGTTNATAAQGGLFLAKGLNYNDFIAGGGTIASGANIDNLKRVYKLSDNTGTLQTLAGFDVAPMLNLTDHGCFVLNGGGTAVPKYYLFNLRAPLLLGAGFQGQDAAGAFKFATGSGTAVGGNISSVNNSLFASCNHGIASGVPSLYFATANRINRCSTGSITNAATNFVNDSMLEVPPGSTTTFPATANLSYIEYEDYLDKFVVLSTNATSFRNYITQYKTDSSQFNFIFGNDTKAQFQSTANSNLAGYFSSASNPLTCWSQNGITHFAVHNTAATYNQIMNIHFSAHYNPDQALITPKIDLSNATKLYKVYIIRDKEVGLTPFAIPTEGFELYYRTSGIDDNTGVWIPVPDGNILSGISATSIQFRIEFKIIGVTCVPSKIYSLALTYEDSNTDSHYNPSVTKSSAASRIFAWRQATSWGGTIPNLRIVITNIATESSVLNDTVNSSANGIWQYSTDGTNWNSWSSAADNVGNYIRYTASSLPDGISVKAVIQQV